MDRSTWQTKKCLFATSTYKRNARKNIERSAKLRITFRASKCDSHNPANTPRTYCTAYKRNWVCTAGWQENVFPFHVVHHASDAQIARLSVFKINDFFFSISLLTRAVRIFHQWQPINLQTSADYIRKYTVLFSLSNDTLQVVIQSRVYVIHLELLLAVHILLAYTNGIYQSRAGIRFP